MAAGTASLFGGTVHGFSGGESTLGHDIFWPLTMLSLGLTAVAVWGLGATSAIGRLYRSWITGLAATSFVGFAGLALSGQQRFDLAVVDYFPAAVFMLLALATAQLIRPSASCRMALGGLVLTFVAVAIEQLEIPLHERYFDHNALYHLVQAIALVLFFLGMRQERPASQPFPSASTADEAASSAA